MDDTEWTVERHLLGQAPAVIALYHQFIQMAVSKTVITLKGTRRGFAGAALGKQSLGGYLDLQRRVEDRRITRSEPYTKRLYVHQFRLREPGELDEQFAGFLNEAFQVGAGAHMANPAKS
jgi:hypothetical protein